MAVTKSRSRTSAGLGLLKEKAKGKGKGKARMPSELIGCRSHTNTGLPICYGFNLGTCKDSSEWQMLAWDARLRCAKVRKHHAAIKCSQFKSS